MSDPLSVTASVAGLVSVSAKVISIAKELCFSATNAPRTIIRITEEMQQMQLILNQVQRLMDGTVMKPSPRRLTMISMQDLGATLSGCVLVCDKLNRSLSEVVGYDKPATSKQLDKVAGTGFERVEWALWREADANDILVELQRHKTSLALMLTIIQCATTAEALDTVTELHRIMEGILDAAHQISSQKTTTVPLRELIRRQEERDNVLDDNVSIRTTATSRTILSIRSINSLRSIARMPAFVEELKNTRAYKRVPNWSDTASFFSIGTNSVKNGSWSMLSAMSLGDLSTSEISVFELPVRVKHVWDSEPYKNAASQELSNNRPARRRISVIASTRTRLMAAIANHNEAAVRNLLGAEDLERRDSLGRTALAFAALEGQEAICRLLLKHGASTLPGSLRVHSNPNLVQSMWAAVGNGHRIVMKLLFLIAVEADLCPLLLNVENNSAGYAHGQLDTLLEKSGAQRILTGGVLREPGTDMDLSGYIHYAIARRATPQIVDTLLKLGTKINVPNSEGQRAIVLAACEFRESLCSLLLESGASLTDLVATVAGATRPSVDALWYLHQTPDAHRFTTVFRVLKAAKARLEGQLHEAIDTGRVEWARCLLDCGADIEEVDAGGRTPLAHAADELNEPICKLLLDRGATIFGIKTMGWKGVDVTQRLEGIYKGGNEVLNNLLASKLMCLDGQLHYAFRKGNIRMLERLLVWGAKVDEVDGQGWTVLARAAHAFQEKTCGLLLDFGARIDAIDLRKLKIKIGPADMTDHLAEIVDKNHDALLRVLNSQSIKIEGQLHHAIRRARHGYLITNLLAWGADITEIDSEGRTPLLHAFFARNPSICETLLNNGASVPRVDKLPPRLENYLTGVIHTAIEGGCIATLRMLLKFGADVDEPGHEYRHKGLTPLLWALERGSLAMVKLLIHHGANPGACLGDKARWSAIHYMLCKNLDETRMELWRYMLDSVPREVINSVTDMGSTPLHFCAMAPGPAKNCSAHLQSATMLVQRGADIRIKNNEGETPLQTALKHGNHEVAAYLRSILTPEDQELLMVATSPTSSTHIVEGVDDGRRNSEQEEWGQRKKHTGSERISAHEDVDMPWQSVDET